MRAAHRISLDERLAAHAADFAACWRDFEVDARLRHRDGDDGDDAFRFNAEGFVLAVLLDPEGWGWFVGREGDDGKIRAIVNRLNS